MQKISPEGKAKVQLQIVLHDGSNSTFHFVNKLGLKSQMLDRERVKEAIQAILPNFKPKVDSELERKNKLLTDNPRLLQLYKDLVISKVNIYKLVVSLLKFDVLGPYIGRILDNS